MAERNVLGGPLEACGSEPLTGFYRDGCCSTGPEDLGLHTICAVVTTEFCGAECLIVPASTSAGGRSAGEAVRVAGRPTAGHRQGWVSRSRSCHRTGCAR